MKFNTNLYYLNEQTDEVLKFKHYNRVIDGNYKYLPKNPFYKFWSFFTYRIIATPIVWFYYTVIKKVKLINKNVLKPYKKEGYFIYSNHTNQFGDAFLPALICFPKKPFIIVHSDNISIPFIGKHLKMWGALPIPNTIQASKNFNNTIELLLKKHPILIYPEKHLWPYYTKIRNFSSTSFKYPLKFNKPVFSFTTVYKLKKEGKKPKIEIYVDGPFNVNNSIYNLKEMQEELRNNVYTTMVKQSKNSNYSYYNYIKGEKND